MYVVHLMMTLIGVGRGGGRGGGGWIELLVLLLLKLLELLKLLLELLLLLLLNEWHWLLLWWLLRHINIGLLGDWR